MIFKKRQRPLTVQKLEALVRRLPENHPKRPLVEKDLVKRLAGYRGEKAVDFHLMDVPNKQSLILHDLRLKASSHYFQLDTIILTQTFILLLEIKNISGTLYFDENFQQMIRTYNEKETAFPDPLLQIQRQEKQLANWLVEQHLSVLPIKSYIIISNPATIIKTSPRNYRIKDRIMHAANLPNKWANLEQMYLEEKAEWKEIKKLARSLLKKDTPLVTDVLGNYSIPISDVLTGVFCSNCLHSMMERRKGSWYCPLCLSKEKDAHLQALQDYYLLIDSSITNRQCRDFLHVSSDSIARKLLIAMNIPFSGTNKGRVYHFFEGKNDNG
ncbi:nuclease-related domain-containing protein [Peribacillus loiseleuriae]|uniref:nuclease-related domain-containing protein n=1 Tax=Peribacillus loiseleuriae TaxID=1679170 RepID=UPI00382623A4